MSGGGKKNVHLIAGDAFKKVPSHAVEKLQSTNGSLNDLATSQRGTKPGSSAVGSALERVGGDDDGGTFGLLAAIAQVADGALGHVAREARDLGQGVGHRGPVVLLSRHVVGGDDEARNRVDGDGGLAAELVGLLWFSLGNADHLRFVEAVDPLGAGCGVLASDDAHDAEQFSVVLEHLGRQLPVQFAQQTPGNRADPALDFPRRLADCRVLVAVAPGGDAQLGNGPGVRPTQVDPVPLGKESAALDDLHVEFREGRIGDVLLLGGGVNHHIARGIDALGLDRDGGLEDPFTALGPDALPEAGKFAGIAGQRPAHHWLTAEELPVWILPPGLDQVLVADIVGMFQDHQSDEQPQRQRGPALRLNLVDAHVCDQHIPRNDPSQLPQSVIGVEECSQIIPEHALLPRRSPLTDHHDLVLP